MVTSFLGMKGMILSFCLSDFHCVGTVVVQEHEGKLVLGKHWNNVLRQCWELLNYFIQAGTELWYSSFLHCGSLKKNVICSCIESCCCQWTFCGKLCRFKTRLKNGYLPTVKQPDFDRIPVSPATAVWYLETSSNL